VLVTERHANSVRTLGWCSVHYYINQTKSIRIDISSALNITTIITITSA